MTETIKVKMTAVWDSGRKSVAVKGRDEQRDETRTLKFNKGTSLRRKTPVKLQARFSLWKTGDSEREKRKSHEDFRFSDDLMFSASVYPES